MTLKRFAFGSVAACLLFSSLAWGGVPTFPGTGGGGGAVSSVSATGGGCVTVSPTTGAVLINSSGCAGGGVTSAVAGTGIAVSGATGAVTFSLAPVADQRILGNVSGGSAAPIALTAAQVNTMLGTSSYTFSTGLTNTSGTITDDLATGKAGGTTAKGGTLTTQSLTLQPNAADTTTGRVSVLGLGISSLVTGTAANPNIAIGASNSGWFSPTSGTWIQWSLTGTAKFYIDANGPDWLPATAGQGFLVGPTGTAGIVGDGASGVALWSASTNRIRVTSGGAITFATGTTFGAFGAAAVGQQTVGANVNNVVASGTTGQFDDFTNGTVYATDYAALHATVSQLARSVAQHTVALRNLGWGN